MEISPVTSGGNSTPRSSRRSPSPISSSRPTSSSRRSRSASRLSRSSSLSSRSTRSHASNRSLSMTRCGSPSTSFIGRQQVKLEADKSVDERSKFLREQSEAFVSRPKATKPKTPKITQRRKSRPTKGKERSDSIPDQEYRLSHKHPEQRSRLLSQEKEAWAARETKNTVPITPDVKGLTEVTVNKMEPPSETNMTDLEYRLSNKVPEMRSRLLKSESEAWKAREDKTTKPVTPNIRAPSRSNSMNAEPPSEKNMTNLEYRLSNKVPDMRSQLLRTESEAWEARENKNTIPVTPNIRAAQSAPNNMEAPSEKNMGSMEYRLSNKVPEMRSRLLKSESEAWEAREDKSTKPVTPNVKVLRRSHSEKTGPVSEKDMTSLEYRLSNKVPDMRSRLLSSESEAWEARVAGLVDANGGSSDRREGGGLTTDPCTPKITGSRVPKPPHGPAASDDEVRRLEADKQRKLFEARRRRGSDGSLEVARTSTDDAPAAASAPWPPPAPDEAALAEAHALIEEESFARSKCVFGDAKARSFDQGRRRELSMELGKENEKWHRRRGTKKKPPMGTSMDWVLRPTSLAKTKSAEPFR